VTRGPSLTKGQTEITRERTGAHIDAEDGLPQDKAEEIVNTVVEHLKARLPAPIASHLDSVLGIGSNTSEVAEIEEKAKSMAAGLGGAFSKSE
jgi:hypothetical protein